jgi:hypothetical protein
MKKIILVIIAMILPSFSLELFVGPAGGIGIGLSRWGMDIIAHDGTYQSDHLSSREPNFNLGLGVDLWLTKKLGIQTGFHYSTNNYNYTYNYTDNSHAFEWKWNYRNVVIPMICIFGIPVKRNKLVLGTGIAICKQMSGQEGGIMWGINMPTEDIPDNLLETSIAPGILIGMEFAAERIIICPSITYQYGLDGISKEFASEITSHYFNLNLSIFYSFSPIK